MGLFYFFSGIGSFIGLLLLAAFNNVFFFSMDSGSINCKKGCTLGGQTAGKDCHLDFYFFFLAAVQFAGIIIFFLLNKKLNLSEDPAVLGAENNEGREGSSGILNARNARHASHRRGNVSDSSRPTSPRALNDGDAGTTTESSTNETDKAVIRPNMKRSIGKDRTGRIGASAATAE